MKVYRSPVYPAIQVRLGSRRLRATAGYINVKDEDVEAFEDWAAKRPHYRIADEDGNLITRRDARRERPDEPREAPDRVFVAPGITEPETDPSMVSEQSTDSLSVPEIKELLREKGLPTSGNRAVLIDRLTKADEEADEDADAEAAIDAADDAADAE